MTCQKAYSHLPFLLLSDNKRHAVLARRPGLAFSRGSSGTATPTHLIKGVTRTHGHISCARTNSSKVPMANQRVGSYGCIISSTLSSSAPPLLERILPMASVTPRGFQRASCSRDARLALCAFAFLARAQLCKRGETRHR